MHYSIRTFNQIPLLEVTIRSAAHRHPVCAGHVAQHDSLATQAGRSVPCKQATTLRAITCLGGLLQFFWQKTRTSRHGVSSSKNYITPPPNG